MIRIDTIDSREAGFADRVRRLAASAATADPELDRQVAAIIADVRGRGDEALLEYTNRFDNRSVADAAGLEVPVARLDAALGQVDAGIVAALEAAAGRIRAYHERQLAASWNYDDGTGVSLGQKVTPLDSVGVYVPGGRASYPSSVLMNVIPAHVAGVRSIVMAVPAPRDELNPVVLAAARIAGVDRVFTIGGAQAVAALAFGTATIPAVHKIVGPGNRWVAAAKRQVFGIVGIDMIAGPSEIVVVADGSADPDWVAMDLFAQAEHDEAARAILVTADAKFAERVRASMERLLPGQERSATIAAALAGHGAFILVKDLDEAAGVVNVLAPEHLQLAVEDPDALLENIRHAGAVFLGHYAAEVLGDYCAGPNHVLPTGGSARFSSPLGVYDFQKRTSIIRCTPQGGAQLAEVAARLARAEGLPAHAGAADLRRKS